MEAKLQKARELSEAQFDKGMDSGLELITTELELAYPDWVVHEKLDALLQARETQSNARPDLSPLPLPALLPSGEGLPFDDPPTGEGLSTATYVSAGGDS